MPQVNYGNESIGFQITRNEPPGRYSVLALKVWEISSLCSFVGLNEALLISRWEECRTKFDKFVNLDMKMVTIGLTADSKIILKLTASGGLLIEVIVCSCNHDTMNMVSVLGEVCGEDRGSLLGEIREVLWG